MAARQTGQYQQFVDAAAACANPWRTRAPPAFQSDACTRISPAAWRLARTVDDFTRPPIHSSQFYDNLTACRAKWRLAHDLRENPRKYWE